MFVNNQKEIKDIYNHLKNSAKKRGIDFNLTISDLYNITFPISCPVLGIPVGFNRGKSEDNSYSFDRIDSNVGYTIDNLIIVSNRANKLKNDATLDELRRIVQFYDELEKQMMMEKLRE